ncbi:MAG: beta-glucosidase [Eubacteriales bacterium]|nr:beta-glucosidase [Eubacteriales bacterium]
MGFRKDFIWGVATAAYQVEGAAFEGGKGRSIWDDFSHTPGKVYGGHRGDVACDHYHRFREDVALMAQLGVKNYRFSLSWPRLLPEGTGEPNPEGLRFYDALIDALLSHGIRPLMTLYHWDLPSALLARGGFRSPEFPRWFEAYAALVAARYGDRVKDFFTFNEPQCMVGLGYIEGTHAPGETLPVEETIPIGYHIHLAHALAAARIRALVPDARIGFVGCGAAPIPETESPQDVEAARALYFGHPKAEPNHWVWSPSWWLDPVLLGAYPEDGLRWYGQYLPRDFERTLLTLHQPLDYCAFNYYEGKRVRFDEQEGAVVLPWPAGHPRTAAGWSVSPDVLYWGTRFLWERYHKPVFITENGMSAHDAVALDGGVHDPNRIDFLHRYLLALRRAAQEGTDVYGYLAWSLMDNFEWSRGYSERFGMVYVDYQTQQRIPKDSALWYRRVMETNGETL